MEISIEQLLAAQRYECKLHFEKEWRNSEILKEIIALDPEEKIANKIHWVRDAIPHAELPDEVKVLKKYLK